MPERYDDLRDRLTAIAEELADLSLDRLRAAASMGADDERRPAAVAEEKRFTRARRSVEKAAHLLDGADAADA